MKSILNRTYRHTRIMEQWRYRPLSDQGFWDWLYLHYSQCGHYNREKSGCTDLFAHLPAICIPFLLHVTPGFLVFECYSHHVNSELRNFPESLFPHRLKSRFLSLVFRGLCIRIKVVNISVLFQITISHSSQAGLPLSSQDAAHIILLHTIAGAIPWPLHFPTSHLAY